MIERRFVQASLWCFAAAILSALGFMHSYRFNHGDTTLALLTPAWPWATGYAIMGAIFLGAKCLTTPVDKGH